MNILVLSWRGLGHPYSGGAEQVTHQHAKAWIRAGHKVTLFTSYFSGAKRNETIDGVRIIRRGNQILGVHLAAFFWYLFNKHDKYDLVIDHFHGIPFFTPLYVRAKKLAVIQETTREVWFLNNFPIPLNWLIGVIGYLTEPWMFLLYKNICFMTGSASAKEALVDFRISGKNITVVHHGVIVVYPSPHPKKEKKFTVVYLGVLSKDKGIEDALRCFSYLEDKGSFNFWVIGRPENKEQEMRVKGIVKELKLGEKIVFWGFVSQRKKFELLAKAHLLINPSVREGWGLVNIEANAMGTPVVGYKVAGVKDSVRDGKTGLLVEHGDFRALAESALKLVRNKALYKKLQSNCKDWASKFDWKESIRKSLKLIESI